MSVGFWIEIDDWKDEAMVRGDLGRRCFETRMTFISQKSGFLRREKREFTTFRHCHDDKPSFEEMKQIMLNHMPMDAVSMGSKPVIVSDRELTRNEYLRS